MTHAVTVGALGTLTTTVMARTRILHAARYPETAWPFPWLAALMGTAAVLRVAGGGQPGLMLAAGVLWSAAMGVLVAVLVRYRPRNLVRIQSSQPG